MKKRFLLICLLIFAMLFAACSSSGNQENNKEEEKQEALKYPESPITMIVPFGAGGATDILARSIIPYLEEEIGGSIVVVNKPGAGGEIGIGELINSKADGYTIGIVPAEGTLILSSLKNEEFKFGENIEILNYISAKPFAIVVNKEMPVNNIEEFFAYIKENPKKVTIAEVGQIQKLLDSMIEEVAGAKITPVSFNSGGELLNAILGGHTMAGYVPCNLLENAISQGLKPIAVTSAEGLQKFTDIPTLKEKGYDVDIAVSTGLAIPAGVSANIKDKWITVLTNLASNEQFAQDIIKTGEEYNFHVGEEFQNGLMRKYEQIQKMINENKEKFVK